MKTRLVLMAILVLVVAACSSDGSSTTTTLGAGADDTTTSTTGNGGSSDGDDTSTTSEPGGDPNSSTSTTSATGTTGSSTTGSGGVSQSCVVGTWVLDDEAFIEQVFEEILSDDTLGITAINPQGGESATTFNANGTVEALRTDWGFEMVTEEGTFDIVINGTQTGTWEIEGNKLLLDLDGDDAFDVQATVTVDGVVTELPQAPVDLPDEAFSSSSDFTCSGDTLAITNEGITSTFARD